MDDIWPQVVAGVVGVAFVVIGRLVDKLLPDPDGKHPLPDPPTTSTADDGDEPV